IARSRTAFASKERARKLVEVRQDGLVECVNASLNGSSSGMDQGAALNDGPISGIHIDQLAEHHIGIVRCVDLPREMHLLVLGLKINETRGLRACLSVCTAKRAKRLGCNALRECTVDLRG